ncbi:MAG: hypothetical protein ACYTGW_04330 [Planctomycetota bacterium]|jgi:hypothetical protein
MRAHQKPKGLPAFPALLLTALIGTVLIGTIAAPVSAQAAWKLPARGAVFYKRERDADPRILGGNCGFDRVEMPPVLLQGELDPRQQYVALAPADLRDLPAWLAFDLRGAGGEGPVKVVVDTLRGLGAIRITGTASAVGDDGEQTLTVTLRTYRAPTTPFGATVNGTIRVRRTVNLERGVVERFTTVLEATFKPRRGDESESMPGVGGVLAKCTIRDSWTLDRIEKNREPAFRARVVDTIRRGAERIKSRLPAAGKAGGNTAMMPEEVDCSAGELALCLLTLVKAEVDHKDPALVAGFDRLRKRLLSDTYSLSVALMAMEALYAPANEREALIAGRIKAPMKRKVPAADFALMKEWTKRLLENYDRSQQRAYLLRFHYQPSTSYDNSNTQYAVLGLYSAHLCDVPISRTVWLANAKHWLDEQTPDGKGGVELSTTSHQDYAKMRQAEAAGAGKGNTRRQPPRRGGRRTTTGGIRAAGWSYIKARANLKLQFPEPPTASMTTAGLTGIALCNAVLSSGKKGKRSKRQTNPLQSKMERARQAGFAWMLRNFSVRTNRYSNIGWYYYYMYGLERVCELSQIALIGDRDWYFEGATVLVEMAAGGTSGHFNGADMAGDCFAILFLKLASPPLPVITRRR